MLSHFDATKVVIALEAMSKHLSPPNNARDGCGKCRDADTVDAAIATIRELIEDNARIELEHRRIFEAEAEQLTRPWRERAERAEGKLKDAEGTAADPPVPAERALYHGLLDRQAGDICFHHPMRQVIFRAGLLACREYMARFVEAQDANIARSIRANWWPQLGADPGQPRKNLWSEWYEGEYPDGRVVGPADPSIEALPYAVGFLVQCGWQYDEPLEEAVAAHDGHS